MRTVRELSRERALLLCAVVGVLLLSGCASTVQYPRFPDQTKKVEDPTKARIYLIRKEKMWAAGNKFLFYGNDLAAEGPLAPRSQMRLIGELGPGSYLCWEEPPHAFRFNRVGGDSKSVCTINLVAGNVYYLGAHPGGLMGDRTTVDILDEKEGQALLKRCQPPNDYVK